MITFSPNLAASIPFVKRRQAVSESRVTTVSGDASTATNRVHSSRCLTSDHRLGAPVSLFQHTNHFEGLRLAGVCDYRRGITDLETRIISSG
jgi:hypothetical protein